MDPDKNQIPENIKTIHLIAVCGTGMGALACLLREKGYAVTGSDQQVYPPMSTFLAERGIAVRTGFDAANLSDKPDLVVVGNAVTRANPEAVELERLGLFYCSMPQAVHRFMAEGKRTFMVVGTHGKTTTSALWAWMLSKAGGDPSFLIGGILKNFNAGFRAGDGDGFVVEGDEYDTAFFDKGPKFLHYHPEVTILTSIEFDHADIYRDLDHVREAFRGLARVTNPDSRIVAFGDDPVVTELMGDLACKVSFYGGNASNEWRLGEVSILPPVTRFEVMRKGERFGVFDTPMKGRHNLKNALAVIAACHHIGMDRKDIARGLETFEGVRRRQETRGMKRGITVIDDFAHHPTAVRETIQAMKPFFPQGRLIAVFEPRSNTSMRNVFQAIYPAAFIGADRVLIREPSRLDKVCAEIRFSAKQLVADLNSRHGVDARYFETTDAVIEALVQTALPGDGILIMSNGGFDNIHERLLAAL